jgi:hypothetical protein
MHSIVNSDVVHCNAWLAPDTGLHMRNAESGGRA